MYLVSAITPSRCSSLLECSLDSSLGPGVIALKDVTKEGALPVCVTSAHSWMLLVTSAYEREATKILLQCYHIQILPPNSHSDSLCSVGTQ